MHKIPAMFLAILFAAIPAAIADHAVCTFIGEGETGGKDICVYECANRETLVLSEKVKTPCPGATEDHNH